VKTRVNLLAVVATIAAGTAVHFAFLYLEKRTA
jgi:hypothetical protein